MNRERNCIATDVFMWAALLLAGVASGAEPVGVVTDLTGPVLVKTAAGSIKVLAAGSSLESGETLVSRPDTYVLVTLLDHSTLALGPETELTIEHYSFHDTTPKDDSASVRLLKGRVRVATGILGTRDKDSFTLTAAAAVIDIRRSTMIAQLVAPAHGELAFQDGGAQVRRLAISAPGGGGGPYGYMRVASVDMRFAQALPPSPGTMAPGLYVQVLDGMIHVSNSGGSQNFSAGQFGFTPSPAQPPVVIPSNPGIQFTPPPAFSSSAPTTTGSSAPKSNNVDCVVR